MLKARAEVKGCVKLNVELVRAGLRTAEEIKPVVEATESLGAKAELEIEVVLEATAEL